MNVIARSKLQGFWEKHPDTETPLRLWFTSVKKAKWKNLNDLKDHYPKADYIGNDRVVFDIKGNRYRIVVLIFFQAQKAYIRFIGTHAEYDKIDATTA